MKLVLPEVTAAERWLRAIDDPIVELLVVTYLDRPPVDRSILIAAATESAEVEAAFRTQHPDGSWGDGARPQQRILSTLWMTKTLAELGLGDVGSWKRAADFLAASAHTDEGVFAIDGRRDGVLSCYVGVAAVTYLLGGRGEFAEPQIAWIRDHQEIRRSGADRRPIPAKHWSDHLAVRYGGCMSDTTCLVGLAKTGQALQCWSVLQLDADAEELLDVIREQFLERYLYRASDGSVVPIGVAANHPERWLDFTYPLDWRTDLIEIIDVVASGDFDARLQPALDLLAVGQLDDGSWPLRRTFRPDALPLLERRSTRRGSPYVTLRILCALNKLQSSADSAGSA